MTRITVPTKLTGLPYIRSSQTIYKRGVDSKILEIYPIDRKVTGIPADITVMFGEAVRDVTISNLIDNTVIDLSYVSFYEDERVKYDFYKDKTGYPVPVKDKVYILTWKYYFSKEPWVIFKLSYTDVNGNALEYEFTIHNEKFVTSDNYILSKDQQP